MMVILRPYQQLAYNLAKDDNSIAILPTGSGKTRIACALSEHVVDRTGLKVLFLVPTLNLVAQQTSVYRDQTSLRIVSTRVKGKCKPIPELREVDVLVATPAAFLQAHNREPERLAFTLFGLVVFDEVHHVSKQHPYADIAHAINACATNDNRPQIFGLTASLSYRIGVHKTYTDIARLCMLLKVSKDRLFTATKEDLERWGYKQTTQTSTDFNRPRTHTTDLNEKESMSSQDMVVDTATDLHGTDYRTPADGVPMDPVRHGDELASAVSGQYYEDMSQRADIQKVQHITQVRLPKTNPLQYLLEMVRTDSESLSPIAHELMHTIYSLEARVISTVEGHTYSSPMSLHTRKPLSIKEWGRHVLQHKRRVLEGLTADTRDLYLSLVLIEHLYEALRVIVVSDHRSGLEMAVRYLVMCGILSDENAHGTMPTMLEAPLLSELGIRTSEPFSDTVALQELYATHSGWFNQLNHLYQTLLKYQALREQSGTAFRCIVFVEQRQATNTIQHYLMTRPQPIKCGVLMGQSNQYFVGHNPKQSEAESTIAAFSTGELPVIIATSVADEGLDVPAANCVIRFDSITTAVSMVQSRGRARQEDSHFIVLRQGAKTYTALERAAVQQQEVIQDMVASAHAKKGKKPITTDAMVARIADEAQTISSELESPAGESDFHSCQQGSMQHTATRTTTTTTTTINTSNTSSQLPLKSIDFEEELHTLADLDHSETVIIPQAHSVPSSGGQNREANILEIHCESTSSSGEKPDITKSADELSEDSRMTMREVRSALDSVPRNSTSDTSDGFRIVSSVGHVQGTHCTGADSKGDSKLELNADVGTRSETGTETETDSETDSDTDSEFEWKRGD